MSSSNIQRYGDAGIHTVEGNVAGSRAARLTKQREKQVEEYHTKKRKIEDEHQKASKIDKVFMAHTEEDEAEFKRQTVGLVSAAEFRQKKMDLQKLKQNEHKEAENHKQATEKRPKKKKSSQIKKLGLLSFDLIEDEKQTMENSKKSLKNPNVETHFLPDIEREKEEEQRRQQLRDEWMEDQERIKNEMVEVTYSYWDGSGHRKKIEIQKKVTIGQFLEKVRLDLCQEFPALRGLSSDSLLYVKEDLIIPHHFAFYDLIVSKARGKSGPLFHFDVHDDIRMTNDARVEKDESHPGKVVERHWYEKSKHIFPASRWEIFDPSVKREKYTIHGGEVQTKKK